LQYQDVILNNHCKENQEKQQLMLYKP
jgi:hypothetical protein